MVIGGQAEPVEVGRRVRHYGTKRWGKVLQAVPQSDGTFEYEIERDAPLLTQERSIVWWASYRIDRVEHKPEMYSNTPSNQGRQVDFDFCTRCGRPKNYPYHTDFKANEV